MNDRTIAVDLAKNVFEIGISERPGHVDETCRLETKRVTPVFYWMRLDSNAVTALSRWSNPAIV